MIAAGKKVVVLLTDDWLDCLKAHTSEIDTCKACLERAVDVRKVFTGTRLAWSVACSEEQVRDLLRLASRHCPGAVGAILDSLERFTASA